jgi:hypothetical protein
LLRGRPSVAFAASTAVFLSDVKGKLASFRNLRIEQLRQLKPERFYAEGSPGAGDMPQKRPANILGCSAVGK